MITRERLLDWASIKRRDDLKMRMENIIDKVIEEHVLEGYRYLDITNVYGFRHLWNYEKMTEQGLRMVRDKIIEQYSKIGLKVKEVNDGIHIEVPKKYFEMSEKDLQNAIKESTTEFFQKIISEG